MTRLQCFVLLAATSALCFFSTVGAQTNDWPLKPIRIVTGFGPGSGADIISRLLAERLAERLQMPVFVENREGAASAIGTAVVARAPADGYTLLLGASTMTVNPHVQASANYDPVKDFVPIIKVAQIPLLMITASSAPYNDLNELISHAKENPGKLSYATSGNGSPSHLSVELIRQATGIVVVGIPYKNVGQAMTDTLAGTVSFYFPAISASVAQIQAGKAKGLVIGASKRSAKAPAVQTISEQIKIEGLEVITWYGLFAPTGTPTEVTARLYAETPAIMSTKEIQEKVIAAGMDLALANTEDFTLEVKADNTKYEKLVRGLALQN